MSKGPIDDLTTPFSPCGVYFSDSDRFEILLNDGANFYRWIPGTDVETIHDMATGEMVGMAVNRAGRLFEPAP